MKKEGILLAVVILFGAAGFAAAQDGELHGSFDLTYQGKFLWRGHDWFGDKSGIQPTLDLDLGGTGLGIQVMGHRANASGFEDWERWDYSLYYGSRLDSGESYVTDWRVGWVYYNFPDAPRPGHPTTGVGADWQELFASASWPDICPFGTVPSYTIVHMWPSESETAAGARDISGWAHIFAVGYDWTVSGILPDTPEQTLHLSAETMYNDGMLVAGADHDWSHLLFGISTDFTLADNLSFTPGLYHQVTMDSSINDDKDETWLTLGVKCEF
ncbi:MAG: hypothetical protein ABIF19_17320 [Planctomycetota bacterium]